MIILSVVIAISQNINSNQDGHHLSSSRSFYDSWARNFSR